MTRYLLAATLAVGGLAGSADAQYRYYRNPYGPLPGPAYGSYSTPGYGYSTGYSPVSPYNPGGFTPGFNGGPAFGGGPGADYVRSLYIQYLRREPDPGGMQTWLNRLNDFGGDYQRLTAEFAQAAALERNANNPAWRFRPYP